MTKLPFIVAKICNVGRRITATIFHIRHNHVIFSQLGCTVTLYRASNGIVWLCTQTLWNLSVMSVICSFPPQLGIYYAILLHCCCSYVVTIRQFRSITRVQNCPHIKIWNSFFRSYHFCNPGRTQVIRQKNEPFAILS